MSSLIVGSIFFIFFGIGFVLWGVMFWLGARWARVEGVSLLRAILLGVGVSIIQVGLSCLIFLFLRSKTSSAATLLLAGVVELVGGLLVTFAVLRVYVRASLGRLILTWLPTLLANGASMLLAIFVLRPFFCEAFVVPTNGMAPTLLGQRWTGVCPRCGAAAFASPRHDPGDYLRDEPPEPVTMICSREMTSCLVDKPTPDPASPDRFLCCKVLRPRRWDVVAFKFPDDPTKVFVQRLVGLPGETVVIDGGAVWINGQKLTAPEGQYYLSELRDPSGRSVPLWGTKQRPAKLGPDEYFMLGDFSDNSLDSRLWEQGAPGHPPYAVPGTHIVGVATHIYWPGARWRVLR